MTNPCKIKGEMRTVTTLKNADATSQSMVGEDSVVSHRIADAVEFAVRAHGDQVRKGTSIPYVSHLFGVAALVLEGGGDEDLAIAGLLHDALEDTAATAAQVEEAFGSGVAAVVVGCSDTLQRPKPPALGRKQLYLEHLEEADADVLLVSLADKLHNARSLLLDFRTEGPTVFERFKLSREETLWYYGELVKIYSRRKPGALADELARVVADLCREAVPSQPTEMTEADADRFVSKLSDLIISDKDGNVIWNRGFQYQDGKPFTGTLDGQKYTNGVPQK
jgi:(p)ppGpp synthase/HD superfamily hydrolase